MLKAGQREHDLEKARKRLEELKRQKGDRLEQGSEERQRGTDRFGGGPATVGGDRASDR